MKFIQPTLLEYPTLEAAWEGANEFLINNPNATRKNGGGMATYDIFIHVYKPWINPDFNFGRILGYKNKKWAKLISNYVNFNYLDLVRSEVRDRERKKSMSYNYTFHFDNAHGSGKDCLIALTFCKRAGSKEPYVIYTTRASEATCRLIFDFLLIKRIIEYVYGEETSKICNVVCYLPFMFMTMERFLFYLGYKGTGIVKPIDETENGLQFSYYQKTVLKKFTEYTTMDPDLIKWKSHRRIALQLQKDKNGNPKSNSPDLFVKDLTLPYHPKLKESDIVRLDEDIK